MADNQEPQTSIRELWQIAYPLVITNAGVVFMHFADRIFLSRFSPAALAASVPGGSLSFTFVSLFMGLAMYTGIFVAQYEGRKKRAAVAVSLWQGIIISIISGVIIAFCTPIGFWLIDLFKHAPEAVAFEKQYFGILNYGGGFIILNSALSSFFIGRGKTKIPMFVSIGGNIFNFGLAYILIFGKLGFPAYGVKGAAWAVIISSVLMIFVYIALIFNAENNKKYRLLRLAGLHKASFLKLLRYGVPNGFSFFMDVLSFSMFSFMTGHLALAALDASNIALTMQMLSYMPLLGLGVGVQVLTGKYMGMGKQGQVYRVVKNACKMGYSYVAVLGILFFAAPHLLINLFLGSGGAEAAEITRLALPLMKIVAVFIIGDCTYLIFGDAIRGAGDTKTHMIIMFVSAWLIMIPGAYYLVYVLQKGIFTVWAWLTFYSYLTAVLMLARFLQAKWRKIDITA